MEKGSLGSEGILSLIRSHGQAFMVRIIKGLVIKLSRGVFWEVGGGFSESEGHLCSSL